MKFIFNLLFIALLAIPSTQRVQARSLFIIDYQQNTLNNLQKKAKEILIEEYGIPKSFIHLRKVQSCRHIEQRSLLHLCLGETSTQIMWRNEQVLTNSFPILREKSLSNKSIGGINYE